MKQKRPTSFHVKLGSCTEVNRNICADKRKIPPTPFPRGSKKNYGALFLLIFSSFLVSCSNKPSLERITTLASYDGNAKFSPDGKTIAFITRQTGDPHVWIFDTDEKMSIPITVNEGDDQDVLFLPDNERLIFSSRLAGQRDLWMVGTNDELIQLTKTEDMDESNPGLDGDSKIVFIRSTKNSFEICRLDIKTPGEIEIMYKDRIPIAHPIRLENKILFERDGNIFSYGNSEPELFLPAARELAVSPSGKFMAYTSDSSHNSSCPKIYLMSRDTKRKVFIANGFSPAWAPDGEELLYTAIENWDIKIIDAETQKDTVVINHSANDESPVFSPDGSRIYFSSDRSGQSGVYQLNMNTGKTDVISEQDDFDPEVSPDGNEIVFTSRRLRNSNADTALWTMSRQGDVWSDAKFLVDGSSGQFSHDGLSVIYEYRHNIWIVSLKDGARKELTIDPRNENHPSFSLDDREIYFDADWVGRKSIWKIPREGGMPMPVTRDKTPYGEDADAQISPDGLRIAFTRSWYDDADIWLMSLSGGEKTTRTLSKDNTHQETHGRWSSDGKRMVFQFGGNADVWKIQVKDIINRELAGSR